MSVHLNEVKSFAKKLSLEHGTQGHSSLVPVERAEGTDVLGLLCSQLASPTLKLQLSSVA